MFLVFKVIGTLCSVAIPVSVCGAQALLAKKTQVNHKKAIETDFSKTQNSLIEAHKQYDKQIKRIQTEKNTLATTKSELTYKSVDVQEKIKELQDKKQDYENSHKTLQEEITKAIQQHDADLKTKTSEIEALWTAEKERVSKINTDLDTSITNARNKNKSLSVSINTLKDEIDKQINAAFYTPATAP